MSEKEKHSSSYLANSEDAPEISSEMLRAGEKKIGTRSVSEKQFKSAINKLKMGRPPLGKKKQLVSIRYDADVIEYFKASGKGWQTRINDILRDYIANH